MRVSSHVSSLPPARQEIQPGVWLDSRLAVWLAAERVLVVADLHWGYVATHRARGHLLPWWGDDEIEGRLSMLVADYQPAEMIWLGDVVHAAAGADRAERYLRSAVLPITPLAGNHDRRWRGAGATSAVRGRWFLHHGDGAPEIPAAAIEMVGHHHPAVTWNDGAGTHLKLPALVVSRTRIVLPAFSPWASGTNWPPSSRSEEDETIWAVAPSRIFTLPRSRPLPTLAAS